jgi:hypothetical protein
MSECILIAIVGAIINMLLALLIPCLLKDSKTPILLNIKKVYATHKQVIITSSVIVFITIYLALKISPHLGFSFDNDISLNPMDSPNEIQNILKSMPSNNGFRVVNLSRLKNF